MGDGRQAMRGLADRLLRAGQWYGDRIAVLDGDRSLTFRQLDERASRLSNVFDGLSELSSGRVAIMLPNSIEFLEADFAAVKSGRAKVPINTRLTADEREWILLNSRSDILVTDLEGFETVHEMRERLPELREVLVVGGTGSGMRHYEQALSAAAAVPSRRPEDPETPSVILYTSGTTGRPKGAASSFRGRYLTTVSMLTDELDPTPGGAMVHAGSMAHGSGSKSIAFYLRGARNILMRRFDGEAFLDLIRQEHATNSFLVPTMIATIVDAMRASPAPLPSLERISYGGAPISDGLLRDALDTFGGVFVQVYGSCEAPHPITVLTQADHEDLDNARSSSIGREVLSAELRLVDDAGNDVQEGDAGELLVGGDSVMLGYWENPEATDAAFHEGYYRTGDVARRDEEGYYYIVDRKREMIISGGLNVYPAEVERVIATHAGVGEVAVIGVPDARWGEAVMAIIVPSDSSLTSDDVIEYCRKNLAGYKKPQQVEFRDALPRGSTGKILKRELRAPFWEGHARMV